MTKLSAYKTVPCEANIITLLYMGGTQGAQSSETFPASHSE